MADPKFGWHILWITPIAIVAVGVTSLSTIIKNKNQKRRIKNIYKHHPDIEHLSKLSGIDLDKELK